ncbi:glycosyltransferase [Flavobacterium branchiophilum]|uniref:Glycosyl transferase n=1 Tax=Flavobacterium branchiophilum TaxID=55197 RepID=A0A2H3KEZ3_9FLAO|nr:glycosyltransferase [Flavobacterium branchiophilum]PDS26983.1 glycosyl transferase [Flavobacterium branchiophilum]
MIFIVILYGLFLVQLIFGFSKIKKYAPISFAEPKTTFTIIVPFKNEAALLPQLLDSFSKLNYPKNLFEIITINDQSTDHSAETYHHWRMANGLIQTTLLNRVKLSKSPKKSAILQAIPIAKYQWIITTDADCIVQPNWLLTFDTYIQNHEVSMVAAPVLTIPQSTFLSHFQYIDMLSLQGTTIGSFGIGEGFMCNGANFAYTKKWFEALNGFEGNTDLASGDDVFLLQKALQNNPQKVGFLNSKTALVQTKSEKSWHNLIQQRIRWGSKSSRYAIPFSKELAVVVLLTNFGFVCSFVGCIFGYYSWQQWLIWLLVKWSFDMVLLLQTSKAIGTKKWIFPIMSSLFYPFFCSYVGFMAVWGRFSWKGVSYSCKT